MLERWLSLTVALTIAGISQAQTCDTTIQAPIVIPVKNVTTSSGHIRRGLQFEYGTPVQTLGVAVSAGWNESYIYDLEAQCSGVTQAQCTQGRGGQWDETQSSTWSALSSISALDSFDDVSDQTGSNGLAGKDTLSFNSSLTFADFPVAIPRISGPDYSTLSLGAGSRLLDIAKNASAIASRSWSLFWGQTGLTAAHTARGAVVLGGLDETQTTGDNITLPIKQSGYSGCRSGMVVEVTDMVVSVPGGDSGSLLADSAQGQGVNYCLEPEFPIITMLLEHWDEWESIDPAAETTGNAPDRAAGGPNIWGLIYDKANVTNASLTITIGGSLEITIPNHQLVQAYYTFASDGSIDVNDTISELMINPLQAGNAQDIPKFGMTFFQAAYLHVNYDTSQFTLWQAANPTGQNSKYAGIGGASTGCAVSNSTLNNGTTSAGSSSTTGTASSDSSSGISGGAIGGIVAGTIVGTLALAGLAFFLWRRKRQAKKGPPSETATPLTQYTAGPEKAELAGSYSDGRQSGYYNGKSELDSRTTNGWLSPQEVPANAVHRPTLEPQELPGQRYD